MPTHCVANSQDSGAPQHPKCHPHPVKAAQFVLLKAGEELPTCELWTQLSSLNEILSQLTIAEKLIIFYALADVTLKYNWNIHKFSHTFSRFFADDSVDVTSEPDDQDVSVAAASHNPNKGQLEVQLGGAVTLQCPQGKQQISKPNLKCFRQQTDQSNSGKFVKLLTVIWGECEHWKMLLASNYILHFPGTNWGGDRRGPRVTEWRSIH